jgi:hypothetical protein
MATRKPTVEVKAGAGLIMIRDGGDSTGRKPEWHQICGIEHAADLVNAILEATKLKPRFEQE